MKSTTRLAAVFFLATTVLLSGQTEVGFIEKFALAPDRELVLKELVPGSEEFYFFHALHYQNSGQKEKLEGILKQWAARFPSSERRKVIENRDAILNYERDPEATLAYLTRVLHLRFDDEQEARNRKPDLPDALDQKTIELRVYEQRVLADANLAGITVEGMERLVRNNVPLRPSQRRVLLAKVSRPDTPGLLPLVIEDLKSRESRGFGEFPIHANLLPEQLAEVARAIPSVKESPAFVNASIRKLAPNPDTNVRADREARLAWLERLWNYTSTLAPSFNSLKASILYQRLQLDRENGVYDKTRFIEYLKLPRRAPYANPERANRLVSPNELVDLQASFDVLGDFGKIGDDTALVRDYLLQILKDEPDWVPWAVWLQESWLLPIFAESKIIHGVGNPEQWASLLSASQFQALRDRVDVDFSPANTLQSLPEDEVKIDVLVKNAPKIIVKIYEINTLNYYLANKRELDMNLSLDGLVANREEVREIGSNNPFTRAKHTFEFPELKGKRGAWVIEFIGAGKSSRALIRKGDWTLLQEEGPAGDLLTVLDEKKEPVRDAVAYLDDRRFEADSKSGKIQIPFTNSAGRKPVVLASPNGEFASLAEFEHHAENYELSAQFHLEREQLLEGKEATLAIRAALLANNQQIPIELLKEPQLSLVVTTLDGVSSTMEVRTLKLDARKVFTHTFRVPDRTASVAAVLSGTVEKLSDGGNKQTLTASGTVDLNGIDRIAATYDSQLSRFDQDYIFELLGKNGEPIADQTVLFSFVHRDFEQPVTLTLRTNAQGRTNLGSLSDIEVVRARPPNQRQGEWRLSTIAQTPLPVIHANSGEAITIPWHGPVENLSLMEKREETYIGHIREGISAGGGFITIEKLPPGDYSLLARGKDGMRVEIRVTSGKLVDGWYAGKSRELESNGLKPVQIVSVANEADALAIKVANANSFTRVHVVATRFLPNSYGTGAPSLFKSLAAFPIRTPGTTRLGFWPNLYSSVREIGDEYRYILDRRQARKLPGNMLARPSLLLNPWDVRGANEQNAGDQRYGGAAGGGGGRKEGSLFGVLAEQDGKLPVDPDGSNIDFLAEASPSLYNLTPEPDGMVRVPRASLKDRQYVQVYVEDLNSAAWQTLALAEVPTKFRDLRLAKSFDPAKPFVQSREITPLKADGSLKIDDISTAELESYDTIAGVYRLFRALNPNPKLDKFEWVARWPELDEKERAAKYSEFACHELNLFLSRKDKEFFEKTILPYLKNKKDKTFIDRYLIGEDLSGYLRPFEYSQLNYAEKCLLARAIPAELPNAARFLREAWELIPPDPAREDKLFETALRGGDMVQGENRSAFDMAKDIKPGFVNPFGAPDEESPASKPAAPVPSQRAQALRRDGVEATDGAFVAQEALEKKLEAQLSLAEAQRSRTDVRPFFRKLGPTKVWAENNYYNLPIAEQGPSLIPINKFWRDFAAWDGNAPFLSPNIAEASSNFTEMMLALAVLDLPFKAEAPKSSAEGATFTLSANSPLIAYHRQIVPGQISKDPGGLLVSQNFYQQNDRYREEGNERIERYVTDEFLVGTVYGANIVVTNPTSTPRKVEVLLQIPQGAMPVLGSKQTNSPRLDLPPYTTQAASYFFYFPAVRKDGAKFAHYPVHVAKGKEVVGSAKPFEFHVVEVLSGVDKSSWNHLSQYGSDEEVFAFLEKANLLRIDLSRVAWRCRQNVEFFRKLIALMERHHLYNEQIYRYGIFFRDQPVITQWLQRQEGFLARLGPWLASKLLTIDPIQRKQYEHLEYWPLINQRALQFGGENRIANPKVLAQYRDLLEILSYKPSFDSMDELSVIYYLFLQDRAAEALERLRLVKAETIPTQLQLDYLRCYAAFYESKPEEARKIASWHAGHPVNRWRDKFAEVLAQADEIEGKQAARPSGPDAGRESQQGQLASTEPSFEFQTKGKVISLTWSNLKQVVIQYYLLDAEFAFSANPFVTGKAIQSPIVKPSQSVTIPLPEGKSELEVPIPNELSNADLLIEVRGGGERKTVGYHANSMRVSLAENYGLAEVLDSVSGKPLPAVYVKVYARIEGGEVRFYKDGYTDLRGKFDYASLNTGMESPEPPPVPLNKGEGGLDHPILAPAEIPRVEKLSILILSENHGAEVREVTPPSE